MTQVDFLPDEARTMWDIKRECITLAYEKEEQNQEDWFPVSSQTQYLLCGVPSCEWTKSFSLLSQTQISALYLRSCFLFFFIRLLSTSIFHCYALLWYLPPAVRPGPPWRITHLSPHPISSAFSNYQTFSFPIHQQYYLCLFNHTCITYAISSIYLCKALSAERSLSSKNERTIYRH